MWKASILPGSPWNVPICLLGSTHADAGVIPPYLLQSPLASTLSHGDRVSLMCHEHILGRSAAHD